MEDLDEVIAVKSEYLFNLFQSTIEEEVFTSHLNEYLSSVRYSDRRVEEFLAEFEDEFGQNLDRYLNSWMLGMQLPAFVFNDLQCYEILEEHQVSYQVRFRVTNLEETPGIFRTEFRTRDGGFGRGPRRDFGAEPAGIRVIQLAGNQTKEIGIVLDSQPFMLTINTLTSRNIPSVLTENFRDIERDEEAEPFQGEQIIAETSDQGAYASIIVDNEDPGFGMKAQETRKALFGLLDPDGNGAGEYIDMSFRNPPNRWRPTAGTDFYGTYRLSSHFIRSGSGEQKVSWTADLRESGVYDIYYYIPGFGDRFRGGWLRDIMRDFHFTVHHADGTDDITIDAAGTSKGWFLLGSFYFDAGESTVELSNKSDGRMVFADAVRWTPRR